MTLRLTICSEYNYTKTYNQDIDSPSGLSRKVYGPTDMVKFIDNIIKQCQCGIMLRDKASIFQTARL